jgi:hypothetical protein
MLVGRRVVMVSNLVPLVAMRASKVAAIREFERHFLRQQPRVPIAILRQPSGFRMLGAIRRSFSNAA